MLRGVPRLLAARLSRSAGRALPTSGGWHAAAPGAFSAAGAAALPLYPLSVGPLQQVGQQSRRGLFIQTQPTPNAHAVMFLPGRHVMPRGRGTMDFGSLRDAAASPLARKLFGVDGVRGVFFGGDFVTVTKHDGVEWAVLRPPIFEVLMDFFAGETDADAALAVLDADAVADVDADTRILDSDSEPVAMVKELLETRVKPAVAEDGGSIVFRGFDEHEGVVRLELQGACSTCSSSSITLKNGVENMLRHYIPEVKRVEEVVGENADPVAKANQEAFNQVEKKLEDSGILRP